jgi:hypothetical protein
MLAQDLGVAEARSRFSHILSRAAYGDPRFILDQRGRLITVIPHVAEYQRFVELEQEKREGDRARPGASRQCPVRAPEQLLPWGALSVRR